MRRRPETFTPDGETAKQGISPRNVFDRRRRCKSKVRCFLSVFLKRRQEIGKLSVRLPVLSLTEEILPFHEHPFLTGKVRGKQFPVLQIDVESAVDIAGRIVLEHREHGILPTSNIQPGCGCRPPERHGAVLEKLAGIRMSERLSCCEDKNLFYRVQGFAVFLFPVERLGVQYPHVRRFRVPFHELLAETRGLLVLLFIQVEFQQCIPCLLPPRLRASVNGKFEHDLGILVHIHVPGQEYEPQVVGRSVSERKNIGGVNLGIIRRLEERVVTMIEPGNKLVPVKAPDLPTCSTTGGRQDCQKYQNTNCKSHFTPSKLNFRLLLRD